MKPDRIKELRDRFAYHPVGTGGATVRELNAKEVYECLDEVESLRKTLDESQTVLGAWQDVFGTTQLTHAKDRLDAAEKQVEQLHRRLTQEETKKLSSEREL